MNIFEPFLNKPKKDPFSGPKQEINPDGSLNWEQPEMPEKKEVLPSGTPAGVPQDAPYAEKDFIKYEEPTVVPASPVETVEETAKVTSDDELPLSPGMIDWNKPIPKSVPPESVWDDVNSRVPGDLTAQEKKENNKKAA